MKKNAAFALLLTLLAFTSACNLLDQTSPNDVDAEGAITDAASAQAALLGCYSALQQPAYYGGQYLLFTEPLTGDATTGGYNVISLDQLGAQEVTPSNTFGEEAWIAIYRVVTNCNYLLEALPKVTDLTPADAGRIESEARAIRALAHFDLLRCFGEHWDAASAYGIPLVTTVQTLEDKPTRATVAASYQFILTELEDALAQADGVSNGVQYLGASGIEALLARVHLYAGNKTEADSYAAKVLDNPAFSLLPAATYGQVFSSRRTPESIFELTFDSQNRSIYNSLTYGRDAALRPELFFLAAEELNTFFQNRPGDVRAALLDFDPANNDATIVPDGRTQKYRGEDSQDNPAYVLRLAEMYLIRAEVNGLAFLGRDFLNEVRTARGLPAFGPEDFSTEAAFQQAVLDERRAEFNFEGHRYFDLARTGQLEAVTGVAPFRRILPIPNREIIASGGTLVQNPGY